MNKIKHLLLLVCMAGCLAACKKDLDPEKQFTADTTAIRNFINTNNIPAVKDDKYGFFYQIIEPGTGTVNYTPSTQITADYSGKLLNGTTFDDSKGTPITFSLGGVITGWQIGIPLIQKGGKIRLLLPSYFGYGNASQGAIPKNSVLDFTVKLVDVK